MQRLTSLSRNISPGWAAIAQRDVTGITADSRAVAPGMIFAALPGARANGSAYIADAVARGACAVLAPADTAWPPGVPPRPLITDAAPRKRLAEIAAALAGPQPRKILAVTGTNGKTSTVDFLRQILIFAGHRAASLGTLGLIAPGFPEGSSLTTPDPVTLAATMASLKAAKIEHVALEASSHGLDQYRLDGLHLAGAGFTNLTRDHLDYHGDMTAYAEAKLRLFAEILPLGAPAFAMTGLDAGILNRLRDIAVARRLAFGTIGEGGSAIRLIRAQAVPCGQKLTIATVNSRRVISLALPGRFQADNALLAAALARAIGVTGALDHLPRLTAVRGRLERAALLPNGAAAYVDYAHTPDALARLLTALRAHATGRLIIVFGAGGDRDRGKRPLMGEAAARLADRVIVTDDNPRGENPSLIRAEILGACPGALEIADRRSAIAAGLEIMGPGDVLAVAGKGHEQGQIIGDMVIPFDDASVIRELAG